MFTIWTDYFIKQFGNILQSVRVIPKYQPFEFSNIEMFNTYNIYLLEKQD